MTIACDHLSFTHQGKRFHPIICDEKNLNSLGGFNTATLFLDASLTSDLNWEGIREQAQNLAERGYLLFWDLNFGLENFSPFDEMHFSTYLNAIQNFTERFYFPFQSQTFGVNLYRGPLIPSLKWNMSIEEDFNNWKEDYANLPHQKDFYKVILLSEFLHKLAASLPDEIPPFALFDTGSVSSPALLAQLLSQEHFSHIYFGLKNAQIPLGVLRWNEGKTREGHIGNSPLKPQIEEIKTGIVFPLLSHVSEKSLALMNTYIQNLEDPYRVIFESHLNESWDELDELILFSECLSPQGKRKTLGFEAAGGKVSII